MYDIKYKYMYQIYLPSYVLSITYGLSSAT